MSYKNILVETDHRGVCRITLNRPESRNAMSTSLAEELLGALVAADGDDAVRVLVLTGAGKAFCGGGDLKWMQKVITQTRRERIAGSEAFAKLLYGMDMVNKPIIGRINGDAFGGGTGLTALCDVSIGARGLARFSVSETKVGLVPANIAPFLVQRMGVGNSRSVMLNGRVMDADMAEKYNLLTRAVDPEDLDAVVDEEIGFVLQCSPVSLTATKKLIKYVADHVNQDCMIYTADRLADAWETEDGKEGVAAFVEKRKPRWWVGN